VDVVKELDLPPDKVQEMYQQYLQLKNIEELVKVFDENYLPSFLELFRIFHSSDIVEYGTIEVDTGHTMTTLHLGQRYLSLIIGQLNTPIH
jgi:hypothetical protein